LETVDKKVRSLLKAAGLDQLNTANGPQHDLDRRERLAAVLWARSKARDCEDEYDVLDPALQIVL
jgi:hypothetical protein